MPQVDSMLYEVQRIAMQAHTDAANEAEFIRRFNRIIELETAIAKAVSNLRHHHMRRGGISVIADALEKAQKGEQS